MGGFEIGQKVAIYQAYYGGAGVTRATVERDTKLYWIVGGRKFRKSDGIEPGRDAWRSQARLMPLDDPRVVMEEEEARKRGAYAKVSRSFDLLGKQRENPERIAALRDALDSYAEVLK